MKSENVKNSMPYFHRKEAFAEAKAMVLKMKVNGIMFRNMIVSAANALYNRKAEINDLNVFPVPDGDTGDNMSMTMGSVHDGTADFAGNVSDCAGKVSSLVLRSARGNSGVILSLFFRGMGHALKGVEEADSPDIARAFSKGVSEAYKAVMKPTEGTILTVMRICAEKATVAAEETYMGDVEGLFGYMLEVSKEVLDQTPELLPTLKQANVVDAGGAGFVTVIEGMLKALTGMPVELDPSLLASEAEGQNSVKADFASFGTENIVFPYCTECIVTKSDEYKGEDTAGALNEFIKSIGDSAVFVDDEEIIKLHVHTADPGSVLSHAIAYGSLYSVKIENMRVQHTQLSDKAKKDAADVEGNNGAATRPALETIEEKSGDSVKIAEPINQSGVVAVCSGQGICDMFTDMGVDNIVFGGQSMNPSTDDLISAIKQTPSKIVYVLPNNKNIVMAASQAAKMIKCKKVVVIKATSIPQGMAALFAYNPDADEKYNTNAMNESAQAVTSISITSAVRDSVVDAGAVSKGEILGLVEGKIYCISKTKESCMNSLCTKMAGAAIITLLYGEGIDEEEAIKMKEIILRNERSDCEVAIAYGGQPLYDYIISAEY